MLETHSILILPPPPLPDDGTITITSGPKGWLPGTRGPGGFMALGLCAPACLPFGRESSGRSSCRFCWAPPRWGLGLSSPLACRSVDRATFSPVRGWAYTGGIPQVHFNAPDYIENEWEDRS